MTTTTTDQIAEAIRTVLREEAGRTTNVLAWDHNRHERFPTGEVIVHTGWISTDTLVGRVATLIGYTSDRRGDNAFKAKVDRIGRKLADDGVVVRIGQKSRPGERYGDKSVVYPTPDGKMKRSPRGTPVWIDARRYRNVVALYDEAVETGRRSAQAQDERQEKLNAWVIEGAFADKHVVSIHGDEVHVPVDVFEQLLVGVAEQKSDR